MASSLLQATFPNYPVTDNSLSTPSEPTIEVNQLVKKYAGVTAVNEVTFAAQRGEIIGFLGPNGAGKSTTMRILSGFIPATSGTARVAGFSVATQAHEVHRRLGYMPENNPLPEDLRVKEYLQFRGQLKGLSGKRLRQRMTEVMERCDLVRAQRRMIGTLSKGFRQRVGIAEAIIAEPEVLIMDEPTIGLDPHQIAMIRDLIVSLRGQMTILISSHILPEIEMTCDRVMIINAGRIVASDTPRNLRLEFVPGARYLAQWAGDLMLLQNILAENAPDIRLEVGSGDPNQTNDFHDLILTAEKDKELGESLVRHLTSRNDFQLRSLHRQTATLEEVFMAATRRSWEVVMENPISQ